MAMQERISAFFKLSRFAVDATYHNVYCLRVILDDESKTLFGDEVDSTEPMATCEQSNLVLDGDTDYRACIGRIITFQPFDMAGQSFNEDTSYTIQRALPDGTGVCTLMLSKNG